MSIKIINDVVIGVRFSVLCAKNESEDGFYYSFATETLKETVVDKFEDKEIYHEDVNPELLALVFDLDSFVFENQEEAIIGQQILHCDVGSCNEDFISFVNLDIQKDKVKNYLYAVDPLLLDKVKVEVISITKTKEQKE